MKKTESFFSQFYEGLLAAEGNKAFSDWLVTLPHTVTESLQPKSHGNLPVWQQGLAALPTLQDATLDLHSPIVQVGKPSAISPADRDSLAKQLQQWMPWRKGPFNIYGIEIDTEWRSDIKWLRLQDHISSLKDRLILDVGCGNGYHCWRMQGAGARMVIGLDPMLLYIMQYYVLQHFIRSTTTFVLPIRLEAILNTLECFDTTFSMGVLYHHRDPVQHLQDLYNTLRPGGELVIETLVIEGDKNALLTPPDRYAKMKNVRNIPSCLLLESWLLKTGFTNCRLIDVTHTSTKEQRVTAWSGQQSLQDFLDPSNHQLTIEGHPAPLRAIFIANRPY